MKLRVCGYCRVSTDLESQKESVDNQIELAADKIRSNPDWEFAGIYADPDYTGTNEERPEFQRMMNDARRHKFDRILVKSISRLARNTVLIIETLKELTELGITIEFEKEGIDTAGVYSELLLTVLSAFAQEESRNISERVKKGLRMRAQNGEVSWTSVYGYTKEGDEEYIIVEDEAEIVRRIFDEYEHGAQPTEIARRLNEDGHPSPSGQDWTITNVKYILTNPKYAGEILTNATYTENHMSHRQVRNKGQVERIHLKKHHDAIVPREQFYRVKKIEEMKRTGQYPFMGMLICPLCGRELKKVRPSNNAYYWGCEDDGFYIEHGKVEDAILRACEREGNEVPQKVDYWWMDGLIDEVTFGCHYGVNDRTVTVFWHDGLETTVDSKVMYLWRLKKFLNKKKESAKPVRGEKRVTKLCAAAGA